MQMSISARLNRELESRLADYCVRLGVSKTEAIVAGLRMLLEREQETGSHPAYNAYRRIASRVAPERRRRRTRSSGDAMRRAIRAKYPG